MDIEKINDFIEAYSRAIQLSPEYTEVLKELLPKIIKKYSKIVQDITEKQDDYDKYIIKPINGKYSVEDFFLNRLMRNVLEVEVDNISNDGHKGGYLDELQKITLSPSIISKQLDGLLSANIPNLETIKKTASKKVVMHEFEHALQSQCKRGGDIYPLVKGSYNRVIEEILKIGNGKYRSIIQTFDEIEKKPAQYNSKAIKHNGLIGESYPQGIIDNTNEILNETEALEMTETKPLFRISYPDETYFLVRNGESSNCNITNYGDLIKILVGEKRAFLGMYIKPERMFEAFNSQYEELFQETFGNEKTAWENLMGQINKIKETNAQEDHLVLETLLVKCLNKKLENTLQTGNITPKTLEKINDAINTFYNNTISSQDESRRKSLEHIQILDSIQERVNQLKQEVTLPEQKEEQAIDSQTKQSEKVLRSNVSDNKMRFVRGFIQAYNNTETEHQYEARKNHETRDIQRVQEIIRTNGLNVMLTADLDGNLVETAGGEFKRQYSQKQVSAMAQLLKAAQLLTNNKKLNPSGKNYLEEFSSVPSIESTLKQMKRDFNDKDSYMSRLKKESMVNRLNGTLPNFPKTQGEIDAASSIVRDADGPALKQEIGITDEQVEKMKQDEEYARYQADDKKGKASEEEKNESNEQFAQQRKLGINMLKRCLSSSEITTSEVVQTQEEIAERKQMQALSIKSRAKHLSTEEQQIFDMLRAKYERTQEEQSNDRKKSKGIEM